VNSMLEYLYNWIYGLDTVSQTADTQRMDSLDFEDDWVYIQSREEEIHMLRTDLDKEWRNRELEKLTKSSEEKQLKFRRWTDHFETYLNQHPLITDSSVHELSVLPQSMRFSILLRWYRMRKDQWSNLLKSFQNFGAERWDNFEKSFIRIPTFNKGKEGAFLDFTLMSYEGKLSGKCLSQILWACSKSLQSFMSSEFSLSLTAEQVLQLEEMLFESLFDVIEMHIVACKNSTEATNKLGSITSKWAQESTTVKEPDAKYESPSRFISLDERPQLSMLQLQNNLLQSFLAHTKPKRVVEEIPPHEKMLRACFFDAKMRLQGKLKAIHERVSATNI